MPYSVHINISGPHQSPDLRVGAAEGKDYAHPRECDQQDREWE